METYLKTMPHCDTIMLNKYVRGRIVVFYYIAVLFSLGVLSYLFAPIIFKKLPFDGWYPFSVESKIMLILLYVQQVLFSTYAGVCFIFDSVVTTFLWVLAARFELLQNEFLSISSERDLQCSIRKHQQLIR